MAGGKAHAILLERTVAVTLTPVTKPFVWCDSTAASETPVPNIHQ